MRHSIPTLAVAATCLLGTTAISVAPPQNGSPRVVQHDIRRRDDVGNPLERDRRRFQKRQSDTVQVDLSNEQTLYFMNLSIGSPAQQLHLHIDTGSSDLWVNAAQSSLCSSRGDPCSPSGTYDANSSSSYQYINGDFNISYVDGSGASGDYVSDRVQFGDVTLEDQQFGVGYVSTSQQGILGIGYPINEVAVAYNGGNPYLNIPANLEENGFINTNAYSLWLNDLDASTGSILFGGINTAKFMGDLQTLPIIPERGIYAEFVIALTSVGANGTQDAIASDIAVPALLDSGSSLMYLPNDIAQAIYDDVGAFYDPSQGAALVDCDLKNSNATLEFTFSEPTISVAMNELVFTASVIRGQPICILGIGPAGSSTPVLGDTFLRSAYVVYDIDNNEISLAQTNFNAASDDNILEITTGTDAVPSATAVENPVTDVAVQSGGAINGGAPLGVTTSQGAMAAPTVGAGYSAALVGAVGAAIWAL